MENKVRDFVESYKKKPMPVMTVLEFIRTHNQEIFKKCSLCGTVEDVRFTFFCPDCGTKLTESIPKKNKTNDTRPNKNKS